MTVPSPPPGYRWRPVGLDDMAALSDLFNRSNAARGLPERKSEDTVRHELTSPHVELARDTVVAIDPAGQIGGFGVVWFRPATSREQRAYLLLSVHPEHQGRALGDALADWCVATAEQRLGALDDGLPRVMSRWLMESQAEEIARFEQRGFAPSRFYWDMERRLGDEADRLGNTAGLRGVEIRTWDPTLGADVRLVHNAAFQDHWGSRPIDEAAWEHDMLGSTGFRPDLSFLAWDGADIVGYAYNEVYEEDWRAAGRKEGWIGGLGVLRSHRRRGIATELMRRSFAAMDAAGLEYAMIGVDSANPSGAHRLYEAVGFTVKHRAMTLQREVR